MRNKTILGTLLSLAVVGINNLLFGGKTISTENEPFNNSNFTNSEVDFVKKNLPSGTTLTINKMGNIAIHHEKAPSNIFFNIYKRENGYIIRKRLSVEKGIKNVGGIMNKGNAFATINDTMAYLNNYATKYPTRMYSRARAKA